MRSREVIGQAKGVLVWQFAMSAEDAFGLLVRLWQHTNTKLTEVAAAFVARVRDRGSAGPPGGWVVTEVVDELLGAAERGPAGRVAHPTGAAGQGVGNRGPGAGHRRHSPPIGADRHWAGGCVPV